MGETEYGIYEYVVSWSLLLATFSGLGFPRAVLRFVAQYRVQEKWALLLGIVRSSWIVTLVVSLVFSGGSLALILWIDKLHPFVYGPALMVGVWLIPLQALMNLQRETIRAFDDVTLAFAPSQVVWPVLVLGGAAVLLERDHQLTSLPVIIMASAMLLGVMVFQGGWLAVKLRRDVDPLLLVSGGASSLAEGEPIAALNPGEANPLIPVAEQGMESGGIPEAGNPMASGAIALEEKPRVTENLIPAPSPIALVDSEMAPGEIAPGEMEPGEVIGGTIALATNPGSLESSPIAPGRLPIAYAHREWLGVSLVMLVQNAFGVLLQQTDIVMVGSLLGPAEAALYGAAVKTSMWVAFVLQTINMVAAPAFAALYTQRDMKSLQALVGTVTVWIFWPSLVIAGGLMVFGPEVMGLFGPKFVAATLELKVLVLGQLVSALCGSVGYLMVMTGHQNKSVVVFGSAALLNIVLNAFFIPWIGAIGAAIATTFTMMVWNIWLSILVIKHVQVHTSIFYFLFRNQDPEPIP